MTKLDKAKKVIDKFISQADWGIFNTRNWVGDHMETVYNDGEIVIDICFKWSYFEVFGLSKDEFEKLERYYESKLED